MNEDWPAVPMMKEEKLSDFTIAAALKQMIETKAKQMFDSPDSMTVRDALAFEAVASWMKELSHVVDL